LYGRGNMKIARFADVSGQLASGIIQDDQVELIQGDIFSDWKPSGVKLKLAHVHLLSPVDLPNILCLGKDFRSSPGEENLKVPKVPLLFLKSSTSVIGTRQHIILPSLASDEVYYKAELAIVVGQRIRNVTEAEATNVVFGYTVANDVGARDCQAVDGQWARAKSFDTFCPLGPWIETEFDSGSSRICSRVNDVLIQDSTTEHVIFNVAQAVSFISRCMTLLPGTVICMGSPGVLAGPRPVLKSEDRAEVEVVGLGVLVNPVVTEP
jgi:2-keto-4-pentenoate hydratase/2-oxohepta-3-ene-1,7-dioic acid hydratase in catechol pathway